MNRLATETKVKTCEYLDNNALTKLSLANTGWNEAAVYVLYRRDARAGNFKSKALIHAVEKGCQCKSAARKQTALRTFARSLTFKADINTLFGSTTSYTTLLAFTSSCDNTENLEWSKRLVLKGASLLVDSRDTSLERRTTAMGWLSPRSQLHPKREMESPALRKVQRGTLQTIYYYSPLFYPMIRSLKDHCGLLLNIDNISPRLACAAPLASGEPAFNVLHAIAMGPADDMGLAQELVSRFPNMLNEEIPATRQPGATPLHIAILTLNKEVFTILMDAGANVHAEMAPVRTSPLNLIIEQMRDMPDARDRKTLKRFLEQLLDAGADVNRPFPVGKGYSPLMTFIEAMKTQLVWPKVMKEVGEVLLTRGANTNFVSLDGRTPLRLLVDTIMSDMSQKNLENGAFEFLNTLIKSYRADPSLSIVGSRDSLLGHVMERYITRDKTQLKLLKQLYKHGARLNAAEAEHYFCSWMADKELYSLYRMGPHKEDISQWKVNQAYVNAFQKKNPWGEITSLSRELGLPQNIPELLWLAFEPSNYRPNIIKELLSWSFDPDWTHPVHSTCIISQLVKLAYDESSSYSLITAAEHCRLLTERGASVLHKNSEGHTPVKLVSIHSPYSTKKSDILKQTIDHICLEELKMI